MTGPVIQTGSQTPQREKVASALKLFRIMAFVVGLGLLLLVLEIVLKYGFNNDILAWWAMPHGFLYMVYLAAVLNLSTATKMPLGKTVGIMLAGCVPFLSFWVERKVHEQVSRDWNVA
ncbi:MAG: DUF3817 domain-containing protein [Dermatophilus congolensis]|nr:DUF3817 domain-containing protein [Dermatophilus congolensis]